MNHGIVGIVENFGHRVFDFSEGVEFVIVDRLDMNEDEEAHKLEVNRGRSHFFDDSIAKVRKED